MADRCNVLLVGHGRLGQLIAAAAPQAGATVAGIIDDSNVADLADRARWRDIDVAMQLGVVGVVFFAVALGAFTWRAWFLALGRVPEPGEPRAPRSRSRRSPMRSRRS